ncbi:MAG: hypothetical protein WD397_14670 [Wenzhouxiangellaceae bacterium]
MFSGGKDSLAALIRLHDNPDWRVERLITTFNESNQRTALHGTPLALLRSQADALELPLTEIGLPEDCDNQTYLARVAEALKPLRARGVEHVAFGDLFLADIRRFREDQMRSLDMTPVFPLWHTDTSELAHEMIAAGLRARVCCVDLQVLSADLLGRFWSRELLAELPDNVDPCGENGEFHTLVVDAPVMKRPLDVVTGDTHLSHDRFCMLDFQPA